MIGGQRHVRVAMSRGSACRCRAFRRKRAVSRFASIASAILFSSRRVRPATCGPSSRGRRARRRARARCPRRRSARPRIARSPSIGLVIGEIAALDRRDPLAADEIVIPLPQICRSADHALRVHEVPPSVQPVFTQQARCRPERARTLSDANGIGLMAPPRGRAPCGRRATPAESSLEAAKSEADWARARESASRISRGAIDASWFSCANARAGTHHESRKDGLRLCSRRVSRRARRGLRPIDRRGADALHARR